MKIIGLHNGHDASIAAFEDGEMLYYWELERVLNKKHLCGVDFRVSPIIPTLVKHCLPRLGWEFDDIDLFVLGGQTEWFNSEISQVVKTNGNSKDPANPLYKNNLLEPYGRFKAEWFGKEREFIAVTHHVSHMAYAYYTSPYDACMTFAYDGLGDFDTTTVAGMGIDGQLHYLVNYRHNPAPETTNNSVGLTYSYLGRIFPFLGTRDLLATAGKAMGLSSYGTPYPKGHKIYETCYNIITSWEPSPETIFPKIAPEISRDDCRDPMNPKCQNLMATFQECLENYLCNTVANTMKLLPTEAQGKLAIAGGCALNVQANTRLLEEKVVDKIYIPPATSDCGIAYGAVLYAYYHVLGNKWKPVSWHNPYLGDTLYNNPNTNPNIVPWLEKEYPSLEVKFDYNYIKFAAKKLAEGKLIAWAHGRCEIGPRALCNRSILCHPGLPGKDSSIEFKPWHNGGVVTEGTMKDVINAKVKHREFWRPFAPVALWPNAKYYFDIDHEQPYMLESPKALGGWPEETGFWKDVAAVVHGDGTCRVQTVSKETNELMHQLLKEFYFITDIPVLLNTSLNDAGRPIANSLEDILNLLRDSDLDYAVIGNYIFSKRE